jgi:hypothetical protein
VRARRAIPLIGVALFVLATACHSIAQSSRSGIELEIQSPDTVRRGDPVRFRLVMSNTSSHAIELDLVGTPAHPSWPGFRVHITDVHGREIARVPRMPASPPGLEVAVVGVADRRRIPVGGHLDWWTVWDQRDNAGNQMPAGIYRVVGIVPLDAGDSIVSATQAIHVLAPVR